MAVKIAGRDAGKKCVVVEELGNNLVLVDGETRRRKCNVKHLEPMPELLDLKKGASSDDVKAAFEKLGLTTRSTKSKQPAERPKKQKAVKTPKKEEQKSEAQKKESKPAEKKE